MTNERTIVALRKRDWNCVLTLRLWFPILIEWTASQGSMRSLVRIRMAKALRPCAAAPACEPGGITLDPS
jgi:hypothetical protein